MEITTIWFLVVLVGGTGFGSLQYYDTVEECQAAQNAVKEYVSDSKCTPLTVPPSFKAQ